MKAVSFWMAGTKKLAEQHEQTAKTFGEEAARALNDLLAQHGGQCQQVKRTAWRGAARRSARADHFTMLFGCRYLSRRVSSTEGSACKWLKWKRWRETTRKCGKRAKRRARRGRRRTKTGRARRMWKRCITRLPLPRVALRLVRAGECRG